MACRKKDEMVLWARMSAPEFSLHRRYQLIRTNWKLVTNEIYVTSQGLESLHRDESCLRSLEISAWWC